VSRLAHCLEEYATLFRSEDLPACGDVLLPDLTRIPPRAHVRGLAERLDERSAGDPGHQDHPSADAKTSSSSVQARAGLAGSVTEQRA